MTIIEEELVDDFKITWMMALGRARRPKNSAHLAMNQGIEDHEESLTI